MNHVEDACQYIADVQSGKIVACEWLQKACSRQIRDLKRQKTKAFPFYFDTESAEKPCVFIEKLPHIKGKWAKEKRLLELHPSQSWFVTTLFGWRVYKDVFDDDGNLLMAKGTRRFRTAYYEVARKNAKSTLLSAIGLFMLCEDGEAGAEIYSAATTHKQAKIVWDDAKAMAIKSPGFRQAFGAVCNAKNIHIIDSASRFEPLHAQGETLDGLNVHCCICDELHAHKKRDLYDVLETATGSREQPMMINITTAGTNRAGICYELRTYLTKILQRVFTDETFFGVIYTLDVKSGKRKADDPFDRKNWPKANPLYGISVYPFDMMRLAKKAKQSPASLNNFLTKRLNVWCSSDAAWMPMDKWDQCANHKLCEDDFRDDEMWMGTDLASKKDINANVRLYKRTIKRRKDKKPLTHIYCFGTYWLPELAIETEANSQYKGWQRRGLLRATPGNIIDMDDIEDDVQKEWNACSDPQECCFDPGHNATQWAGHLEDEGIEMVEVRPSVMNFSEPMKWLEALVIDGRFHHDGNEVLTWMISNVVVRHDNKDNIYPRKERVENKIDGAVAICIGMNRVLPYENEDADPVVMGV